MQSGAEYMSRLPEFDSDMATRLKEAEASGEVLRYVGVVDLQVGIAARGCGLELGMSILGWGVGGEDPALLGCSAHWLRAQPVPRGSFALLPLPACPPATPSL